MSGGDVLSSKTGSPVDQRRELQVAVAVRARQRRAARGIFPDEVGDDRLFEPPLEVQDVVRDADDVRDTPRIVQVVEGTAAPEGMLALPLIVELHREADDLVSLLGQQSRGDRRVHAARHRNDDTHL